MTPILQKLYYGNLRGGTVQIQTDEYLDSRNSAKQNRQWLKEECSPKQYERILILLDEYDTMNSIDREAVFQQGFSLGVRLVLEALSAQ